MNTYLLILIAVIVIGIPCIFLADKYPRIRIYIRILFSVVIIVLSYLLYKNINRPMAFDKELAAREKAAIQRLKDIRTIELAYKDKYGKYTGDFNALIKFVKTDSFEISQLIQTAEWNQDEITKDEALKKGILKKIPAYKHVADSIWKNPAYDIEKIRYIPYTDEVEFSLGKGEVVTGSKVTVNVFECYALYEDLLNGMDEQLVVNYIDEKTQYGGFEGLKVGSLEEATNNAGNWEQ